MVEELEEVEEGVTMDELEEVEMTRDELELELELEEADELELELEEGVKEEEEVGGELELEAVDDIIDAEDDTERTIGVSVGFDLTLGDIVGAFPFEEELLPQSALPP
ncbi:hypothetical protein P7C70_g4229, partial [Phenoliferia sp. Uapishka_3]